MDDLHKRPTGSPAGSEGIGGQPARQQTSQTAAQVQADVAQAAEDAKQQVKGFADNQRGFAAEKLEQLGTALRSTARTLGEENHRSMASMAEDAARQIDRLADRLKHRDVDSLVGDLGSFARRQPTVFIGGAITAGFLLARFLKSSEADARQGTPVSSPRRSAPLDYEPMQGSDSPSKDPSARSGVGGRSSNLSEPRPLDPNPS